MPLHPSLETWLKELNEVTIPNAKKNGFKQTPINAREGIELLTRKYVTKIPEVAMVLDDVIYSDDYNVPVRIYNTSPKEQLAVIIFVHGGGHMSGSVTVYDPICRKLAKATNQIVVSVEYRRAPESPFPAALTDVINSVKGIWTLLSSNKIEFKKELTLIGDSAGGALVSSATIKLQNDKNIKINNQVLIYPSLDYTMSSNSYELYKEGYLLHSEKIAWYFNHYFQNNENRKKASTLWQDITGEIPNTLILTAEFDPLCDEGLKFYEKLKSSNIPSEHHVMKGMIHTYLMMEDLVKQDCEKTYQLINNFLNKS